jgi:hypothetical protein
MSARPIQPSSASAPCTITGVLRIPANVNGLHIEVALEAFL